MAAKKSKKSAQGPGEKKSASPAPAKRSPAKKTARKPKSDASKEKQSEKAPAPLIEKKPEMATDSVPTAKEFGLLQKAHAKLEANHDALKATHVEVTATKEELSTTVVQLEKRTKKLEAGQTRLERESNKLKEKNAGLREQTSTLKDVQQNLRRLTKESETSLTQLEILNAELESTRKELNATQKASARHESRAKKSKEQLDETRKELRKHKKDLKSVQKDKDSQDEALETAQKSAEEQALKIGENGTRLDLLGVELDELRILKASLEEELTETKQRLEEATDEVALQKSTLEDREKTLREASGDLESLQSAKEELDANIVQLQEAQELGEILQQDNNELTEAKTKLEAQLKDACTHRDLLDESETDLKKTNDHLTRSNEGLLSTNEELASTNRGLTEANQKLTAANEELSLNLGALEETNHDFRSRQRELTIERNDLVEKTETLESSNRELDKAVEESRETQSQLNEEVRDLGQRVREIGLELQDSKIEVSEQKRRSERLQSDVEESQKLVDVTGAIVLVVNKNHKITLVNQQACELLGETETELLGQDWFDSFVAPALRTEKIALFSELLAGDMDPVGNQEYAIRTQTEDEQLISWHVSPLEDESGERAAVLLTGENVTQRRKIEREMRVQQERFRNLADAFPVLISYVDSDQKYRFVNSACDEWLEYSNQAIVGRDVQGVVGDPAYEVMRGYIDNVLAGWQVSFDKEIIYKNGKKRYIHAIYVPHFSDSKSNTSTEPDISKPDSSLHIAGTADTPNRLAPHQSSAIPDTNPRASWVPAAGQEGRTGDRVLGYYELVTDITDRKDAEIEFRNQTERLHSQLTTARQELDTAQDKVEREVRQRKEADRQLRETQDILQGILSNRCITLSRIDENGIFTRSVGSGLTNWGLKDDELVGVNAFEVYPDLRDSLRQALRGEEVQFIDRGAYVDSQTQEEQQIFLQNYLFPDRVRGKGMFCLSIDITDFCESDNGDVFTTGG